MDDLISRQVAIATLDDRMSSLDNVDMQIAMGFAKGIIHELPSVNPQEPKTGHWIEGEVWEDTDGGWGRWQKCSICRQSEHHKKNFCPNCGAKMKEGE